MIVKGGRCNLWEFVMELAFRWKNREVAGQSLPKSANTMPHNPEQCAAVYGMRRTYTAATMDLKTGVTIMYWRLIAVISTMEIHIILHA
jgi:hypothetical protein